MLLLVEEFHELGDAEGVDAHLHLLRLGFEGLVERLGHPYGDDPLALPLRRPVVLPGAEAVEHLTDAGVLRRAFEPRQGLGVREGSADDPFHAQHLPEEHHPLRIHGIESLRDLQDRRCRVVVSLG